MANIMCHFDMVTMFEQEYRINSWYLYILCNNVHNIHLHSIYLYCNLDLFPVLAKYLISWVSTVY